MPPPILLKPNFSTPAFMSATCRRAERERLALQQTWQAGRQAAASPVTAGQPCIPAISPASDLECRPFAAAPLLPIPLHSTLAPP